ncbi:MAG: enoyl-CoA hydratase/isomerase family protein [Burkholderiales bacterium]|nr:enoyl-CoA hydratase/isomerase family protein [Burkholderiales bacterium]
MATTERIVVRKEGALGRLVFNNLARHNAISLDMAEAVPEVIRDFESDAAIRVVILSGAGERAFAAGSDISSFGEVRSDPGRNKRYNAINENAYHAVYRCAKPTIAMIRGYCIGGGLDFAASCDLRVCSEDSTFAVPAGRLGLGYGHEGIERIGRVIGTMRARDMLFTARRLSAAEALAIGLADRVWPVAEFEREALAYAELVAANAPLTVAALKAAFLEYEKPHAERDFARPQSLIDKCFMSEDYQEGRAAFAGKRKPDFKGR